MKVFKHEKGEIEYRLPNAREVLGMMKIICKHQSGAIEDNITMMEYMIDELKKYTIKVEFENAKSYEDLLNSSDYLLAVFDYATEFMGSINIDQKKRI